MIDCTIYFLVLNKYVLFGHLKMHGTKTGIKKYKWCTMTGEDFNKISSGITFIKLTNSEESHRGYQFKDGLNVDKNIFTAYEECCPGGIYFIEEKYMMNWIFYNREIGCMRYVRKVTIPDDANVYIEDKKIKADKIILGTREPIAKNIYLDIVKNKDFPFESIPDDIKDRELCIEALKVNSFRFMHIPSSMRDKEMCMIIVNDDCDMIHDVPVDMRDRE